MSTSATELTDADIDKCLLGSLELGSSGNFYAFARRVIAAERALAPPTGAGEPTEPSAAKELLETLKIIGLSNERLALGAIHAALAAAWAGKPTTARCPLCRYQHGHSIGCVNNPVDIALRAGPGEQPSEAPRDDTDQSIIDDLQNEFGIPYAIMSKATLGSMLVDALRATPAIAEASVNETAQDAALQALSDSGQAVENLEAAQNYRWLRDRAIDSGEFGESVAWCVVGTSVRDCRPVEGAELDAVIALARAADAASRSELNATKDHGQHPQGHPGPAE